MWPARQLYRQPGTGRGLATASTMCRAVQCRRRIHAQFSLPGAPDRGTSYSPAQLALGKQLGKGGFGEVYQGVLVLARGEQQQVVLKRVKDTVKRAAELQESEHLLSAYASWAARDSVAQFLGFCDVVRATSRLSKGLWLVWAYQGSNTLAHYLKQRNCLQGLARDLCVHEDVVVPTVMQHILRCLEELHAVGLVHRDVKPGNLLLCEHSRRIKLIDLGAACDLRSGTNYLPTETINDPCYCPPEEFVLPTNAPHLSRHAAPLALALSPLLWAQHRPGCFDSYSAGVTLLQLALPPLRTTRALREFRRDLALRGGDLREWRARAGLAARDTLLLDARGGEGWDLAQGLLRPRKIVVEQSGHVKFTDLPGAAPRLTAAGALKHSFIKRAAAPTLQGSGGSNKPAAVLGSLFGSLANTLSSGDDLTPSNPVIHAGAGGRASRGRGGSAQRGAGLWGLGARP